MSTLTTFLASVQERLTDIGHRLDKTAVFHGPSEMTTDMEHMAADLAKLIAIVEQLYEGNAEVIRNSHDLMAKKSCSRVLEAVARICAGEAG